MGRQEKDGDPIREVKEWQEHRYDPGYFTGGNIDPLLKAGRPNKYGYFLLFGGVAIMMVVFFGPDHLLYWFYATIEKGFALLMIFAGLRLIRKPHSPRSRKKNR